MEWRGIAQRKPEEDKRTEKIAGIEPNEMIRGAFLIFYYLSVLCVLAVRNEKKESEGIRL